jgi:hypothetical protein
VTGATFKHTPEFLKKVQENRDLIMSEMRTPYRVGPELDRPIDIPALEDNMTVAMGNMSWHFHREQPFTWLQIKLLRFCLGLTVSKNGT